MFSDRTVRVVMAVLVVVVIVGLLLSSLSFYR